MATILLALMWASVILCLLFSDNVRAILHYLLAFVLCWIVVGSLAAYFLASAGPCYYERLFGDAHFAPIILGPMADQKRFHPEGELATARGASAAKAAMVVSSDASVPLAEIAQVATTPLWLQVYAGSPKTKDVLAEAGAVKTMAVAASPRIASIWGL